MGKTKTKKSKMTKVSRPRKNVRNGKGSKKNKTVKRRNFKKRKSLKKMRGGAAALNAYNPPEKEEGFPNKVTEKMEQIHKKQDEEIKKQLAKGTKRGLNKYENYNNYFYNVDISREVTNEMKQQHKKQNKRIRTAEAEQKNKNS